MKPKSADAVTVVDLAQARRRSADLGEVLTRVAGVSIRRFGGLGSEFRLSINGLYDRAIRIFVDGVPIDRTYAMSLANVPVNMIDNVEIYRGVVPLRLGADALGGAINLVRPRRYETGGQASYLIGSFGQHRAHATARYRHDATGVVLGAEAFLDRADNDYLIDVEVEDTAGRLTPARVRRFHDAYQGYGAAAELGVVEQPWAKKLMLRGFTSRYRKDIQHNVVMRVPYGEAEYGERVLGGILTYENLFADRYALEIVGSYAHRTTDFVDDAAWVYDWRGRRVRERNVRGEIGTKPRDQVSWQHSAFARATLEARIRPGHLLTLSVSPSFATRIGDERMQADPVARDPQTARHSLLKSVAGLAYTAGLGKVRSAPADASLVQMEHHRFENVLFVKSYLYRADMEEALPEGLFRERARRINRLGGGDTLRLTLVEDWLLAKLSYEYAVRLPDTDEVFGDGVLILPNLALEPELSHNANQELQVDLRRTSVGDVWLSVNLFVRRSENMIVLLGDDRFFAHQNVYRARALGVESTVKWTSPGKYVTLDGQLTYTDARNVGRGGAFGDLAGDRIPNRPWLHASWGGFLHFERVLARIDNVEPFYRGRFVGDFYRGWESLGLRASKQQVPSQVSHDVGLTYALKLEGRARLYGTFEVQNVADAPLYDMFGVQRPGRAFFFKLTGDI